MRLHRQTFLALLAAICGGTLVPATASAVGRYEPKCDAPRPTCEAPPSCEAPPKKCEPCQPPPAAPVYVQPPGMFVQPQGSGPVRGPVEQSGVEGATITFPELQLRMPSIRFPGRSRYRENARMELNPASAPYVEAPAAPMMAAPAAPMAAAPMAAPMMAPMQAPMMQAPMMAAGPVMQAPMMAQPMMAPMMQAPMYVPAAPYYAPPAPPQQAPPQQAPPQAPPQQAPPQYAPPSCAPPSYAPQCDGQAVGQLDPLEEKLRRIEAAERRLHAQTLELQRLMQQMPSAMTGTATPQNSIPLRPVGPTTLRPAEVHQPLTPPQPPPDLGRRPVVPPPTAPALAAPAWVAPHGQYPARPAGFYAEPIPAAPRTIVQPAGSPTATQVIREPSAPRGQITRLQ